MHWGLRIFVVTLLYILNSVPEYIFGWSESRQNTRIVEQPTRNLNASMEYLMPVSVSQGRAGDRGPAKVNAPQAVGPKCRHCGGEFGSRTAMDVHRRHRSRLKTQCANPDGSASLSFTARFGMSTGILRQHHVATLGRSLNTCGARRDIFYIGK